MKVCHLTSAHKSNDTRIFHKECVSLAKAGYEVYLVAPGESFEKEGVQVVGVGEVPKSRIKRMKSFTKLVYQRALEIEADIYHFHDPELLPYAMKLKKKGKIVIFDSHEFYGLQIKEKGYIPKIIRNVIASSYMKYEAYINRRIDATIGVCTITGKDYFKGRCKKRIFITNAAMLDGYIPTDGLPFEQRKTIAYMGGLNHARGITYLIQGTAQTKATLVLGGNFNPEGYQEELQQMPEYSCVDYRGFLSQEQVVEVLDRCLAGVATLLNIGQYYKVDTLATKVYEYLAMGLPVIISNTPYQLKMIDKYKFGIAVDPANPEEIANAINYLLEHPQEAYLMGQRGRYAALNKFNWGVEEKKLLALYAELSGELKIRTLKK